MRLWGLDRYIRIEKTRHDVVILHNTSFASILCVRIGYANQHKDRQPQKPL